MNNEIVKHTNGDVEVRKLISVEEAIKRINSRVSTAMKAQRVYMDQIWFWGETTAMVEKPWGRKVDIYEALSKGTGIHHTTLRQYEALYDQFCGKKESFDNFIDYYQRTNLLRLNFSNVSKVLKLLDKIEPEFQEPLFVSMVEGAVKQIANLNERVATDKVDKEEAESVLRKFEEEILEFERNQEDLEDVVLKQSPPESEVYLNWIRSHRCLPSLFCDCPFKDTTTHAHHTEIEGRGIKGSDFSAVPLCPTAHKFFHDHGEEAFEEKYHMTKQQMVAEMLHRAATNRPLYFKNDLTK